MSRVNDFSALPGSPLPESGEIRSALAEIGVRELLDMRLVEYLVQDRDYQLADVVAFLQQEMSSGLDLKTILERADMLGSHEYLNILAELHNMEPVALSNENIETEMAQHMLSPEQAAEWRALPYSRDDLGRLLVALSDVDPSIRDALAQALPRETIVFRLADAAEISTWIERVYDPSASGVLAKLLSGGEAQEGQRFVVREAAIDSRIVRIVDKIIDNAHASRASDIHIEPGESKTEIRFRVDGLLRTVSEIQRSDTQRVTARIKTMAQMRVDEHRMPQDGRATTRVGEGKTPLDLRVVTAPTIYGEQISIRLLDPTQAMLSLEDLGMSQDNLSRYQESIRKTHGVCLVVGPTGSGKSTTLYSSLARVIDPSRKIISIEDPVEYRLQGITQMDVSGPGELDFANALRSILRADPDIIMVGEIRDSQTAQIAIDAALTGHFLYSTLHTNSALGSVVRLARIGVDRFLAAEAIEVIVAQRLIRKLCSCKIEQEASPEILRAIGAPAWALAGGSVPRIFQPNPSGCPRCAGQGYYGRTGIHEVVQFSEELRQAIVLDQGIDELEKIARSQGSLSLRDDAMQKVLAGDTSPEEMRRVTV